jgi:hypothetical protein
VVFVRILLRSASIDGSPQCPLARIRDSVDGNIPTARLAFHPRVVKSHKDCLDKYCLYVYHHPQMNRGVPGSEIRAVFFESDPKGKP